jgi:hypothetical protein
MEDSQEKRGTVTDLSIRAMPSLSRTNQLGAAAMLIWVTDSKWFVEEGRRVNYLSIQTRNTAQIVEHRHIN